MKLGQFRPLGPKLFLPFVAPPTHPANNQNPAIFRSYVTASLCGRVNSNWLGIGLQLNIILNIS
ncbi:MAG: hypothetical protein CTY16_14105 [Methylobacter sp.]|nr:MAG: hypothetical protein CTY16_14105 [Methylobacter sp.]